VKGNLYIPFAEIKEPFYAWYDKGEKKSRIDYYGGKYYYYEEGPGFDAQYRKNCPRFSIAIISKDYFLMFSC
jgi:hypothetical protein